MTAQEPELRDMLRLYMKRLMLSNRKLASKAGVTENTISRILNEEGYTPSRETMQKIAVQGLGLKSPEEIWRDPFGRTPIRTREFEPEPEERFDIKAWLNDPNATINGKPATPEAKEAMRQMIAAIEKGL
jgi:transcriptional regulator with XRE-family HTH domain